MTLKEKLAEIFKQAAEAPHSIAWEEAVEESAKAAWQAGTLQMHRCCGCNPPEFDLEAEMWKEGDEH